MGEHAPSLPVLNKDSVPFQKFEEGFARMTDKLTRLSAFVDEKWAVIVYACDTSR